MTQNHDSISSADQERIIAEVCAALRQLADASPIDWVDEVRAMRNEDNRLSCAWENEETIDDGRSPEDFTVDLLRALGLS